MADIKFSCSSCGQHILVEKEYVNCRCQCPNCQEKLIIPDDSIDKKAMKINAVSWNTIFEQLKLFRSKKIKELKIRNDRNEILFIKKEDYFIINFYGIDEACTSISKRLTFQTVTNVFKNFYDSGTISRKTIRWTTDLDIHKQYQYAQNNVLSVNIKEENIKIDNSQKANIQNHDTQIKYSPPKRRRSVDSTLAGCGTTIAVILYVPGGLLAAFLLMPDSPKTIGNEGIFAFLGFFVISLIFAGIGSLFVLKTWLGKITISFLCFIAVIMISCLARSGEIGTSPSPPKKQYNDSNILSMAQLYVKKYLKSPTTAKFKRYSSNDVKKIGPNHFQVKSYVDAQNSFGAMIRTYFSIDVVKENGEWYCVNFRTY